MERISSRPVPGHPPGVRRELKSVHLQFLVIGTAIGSGLFVGTGQALAQAGPALLAAYTLCAGAVFIVARCLGQMTVASPGNRAFPHLIGLHLGRKWGVASGWGFWLTTVLIGMAELTAVGALLHSLVPAVAQWMGTAMAFFPLVLLNFLPARFFGRVEIAMSLLKILVIVLFIALAAGSLLWPGRLGLAHPVLGNLWRPSGFFATGVQGFAAVLPIALFAFGGVEIISLAAAETVDPGRAVPRAVNRLVVRFAVFYLGAIGAVLILMPWTRARAGVSPFLTILQDLGMPGAGVCLAVLLISCVLSSCNAALFASARTLQGLAQDKLAPLVLAHLDRDGVPATAVIATAAAISLAIVLNAVLPAAAFGLLMLVVSVLTIGNWALIVCAQMSFAQKGGADRAGPEVPLGPWSNGAVLAFLLLVLVLAFRS